MTASSLAVNRRLASIATSRASSITQRRKKIDLAIDLTVGLVVPALIMAASYVVQTNRYAVYEGFGCELPYDNSMVAIFCILIWPIVIGVVSAGYGSEWKWCLNRTALTLRLVVAVAFFLSRRLQFKSLLRSSQSGLDTSQYVRLVSLASLDLCIGLPISIYYVATSARTGGPWTGLDAVHRRWHTIPLLSAAQYMQFPNLAISTMIGRWICPLLGLLFFVFFGVSMDAITEYNTWIQSARRKWGWQGPTPPDKQLVTKSIEADLSRSARMPKLGSVIATPAGDSWRNDRTAEENRQEYITAGNDANKGMVVSVSVEKEIV